MRRATKNENKEREWRKGKDKAVGKDYGKGLGPLGQGKKRQRRDTDRYTYLDKQNVSHTYTGQTKYHQTQIDNEHEQNRNSAPNHKFLWTGDPLCLLI